jgi:hypothetical protein
MCRAEVASGGIMFIPSVMKTSQIDSKIIRSDGHADYNHKTK